jgi:hypothetical protein
MWTQQLDGVRLARTLAATAVAFVHCPQRHGMGIGNGPGLRQLVTVIQLPRLRPSTERPSHLARTQHHAVHMGRTEASPCATPMPQPGVPSSAGHRSVELSARDRTKAACGRTALVLSGRKGQNQCRM